MVLVAVGLESIILPFMLTAFKHAPSMSFLAEVSFGVDCNQHKCQLSRHMIYPIRYLSDCAFNNNIECDKKERNGPVNKIIEPKKLSIHNAPTPT